MDERVAFLRGLVLWLWIALLLTACQAGGGTKPVLKIGLVAPFEGLHRPLGYDVLFAVKLALRERNAGGGVAGHRVELIALNDFDDPVEAADQARALILDPAVQGVIGHLSAATVAEAMPIYREAGLAVIVPWSVSDRFARPEPGALFVAATLEEADDYLRDFLAPNKIVRLSSLTPGTTAEQLAGGGAVLLDVEAVAAGDWVRRVRATNVSTMVAGLPDAGSQQLVAVAGTLADGIILVSPGPAAEDTPANSGFVKTYLAEAGFSPSPRAALAYDASHILLDSLEEAILSRNDALRQGVINSLRHRRRQGVTGFLAFDEFGRRRQAPLWLYQIENGRYPGRRIAP
jgi:ABC-type branched-subunit amino acid transport system substrate-binding protein